MIWAGVCGLINAAKSEYDVVRPAFGGCRPAALVSRPCGRCGVGESIHDVFETTSGANYRCVIEAIGRTL